MKTAVLCVCAGVLFAVGFPAAAGDKDKAGKEAAFDPAKLVGKWKYVSGEKGGTKVEDSHLKDQVTITKDTLTIKGEATFVMKYEVNAKKDPVTIKFTMTESPFGPGAVALGIIDLKGDDLKICYDAAEGKEFPKKFATKEGEKMHLFVLKRVK
jgi:uncharacterized protein (TIGR03067 family)